MVDESSVLGSEKPDPLVVTGVEIVELEVDLVVMPLLRSPSSHL